MSAVTVPEWVDAAITKAREVEADPPRYVIPNRYPFTYAYDFVRSHRDEFADAAGKPFATMGRNTPSRSDVAGWFTKALGGGNSRDPLNVAVARRIADAAIEDEGLVWPDGITPDIAIAARSTIGPDGRYSWT